MISYNDRYINAYQCIVCENWMWTKHKDEVHGVTPASMKCRSEGGCHEGLAMSLWYPPIINGRILLLDLGDIHIHWEWYKPNNKEYSDLSVVMRDHVDQGGLILRYTGRECKVSDTHGYEIYKKGEESLDYAP